MFSLLSQIFSKNTVFNTWSRVYIQIQCNKQRWESMLYFLLLLMALGSSSSLLHKRNIVSSHIMEKRSINTLEFLFLSKWCWVYIFVLTSIFRTPKKWFGTFFPGNSCIISCPLKTFPHDFSYAEVNLLPLLFMTPTCSAWDLPMVFVFSVLFIT